MTAWATYPILRCLEGPEQVPRLGADTSRLPDLYQGGTVPPDGMCAISLARHDLDALTVDGHRKNVGARLTNGRLHTIPCVRLANVDYTATATCSADFASQSAVAPGRSG